ncbi:MAG: ImmA/IrrE family metallo-endopeptidase [Ruthenibacterium lactatiformans]|uniref:ImmA/IrrE family metallo-endopeptidase n=1 Tax=Ruthenibacterium lactatiformans TaxID=1550024 RepID=UPI003992EA88
MECPLQENACMCLARGGIVAVDSSRFATQREKVTALIHEEGHFMSGAFYVPFSPYQEKAQAEYRADKAAILKRIPLPALVEEMRRGFSVWEIAEHFNVDPSFIWRAYTIYRDNLGVNFEALA